MPTLRGKHLNVPPGQCFDYGSCIFGAHLDPSIHIPEDGKPVEALAAFVPGTDNLSTDPFSDNFPDNVLFIGALPGSPVLKAANVFREQHGNAKPEALKRQLDIGFDVPPSGIQFKVTLRAVRSGDNLIISVDQVSARF